MCLARVGSGFLCDLEQVTSFLATAFFCAQVSCTCRQVSRPDRAGLELDVGKMLGSDYRSQELQRGGHGAPRRGHRTEGLG